jgi:hypothetical protein
VRIDRSDPADEPGDAHIARRARSAPDDPDSAGKDRGTAVSGDGPPDSSLARPDSALRTERTAAYRAVVDAVYRQYTTDHGYARVEGLERETGTQAMRRIEAEDRLKGKGQLAEVADLKKGEAPQAPDDTTAVAWDGSAVADHDGWVWDHGGDVPDDPRNYSNPKTGRFDASWSTYDRAIAAAREHTGGDLGPDSIKMYDYTPETGEGTGTLIGEQTPDRLRGWRIDSQDGHVNWWDWTGGKKGAGGAYGHDWFPEDPSTPGSRYIGWAPWQDSGGNILEGN